MDVPKPAIREALLPDFFAAALTDVGVRLKRLQRCGSGHEMIHSGGVQHPVASQGLTVAQGDAGVRRSLHTQADMPGEVLAEVCDEDARPRLRDGDGGKCARDGHRRTGERCQPAIGRRQHCGVPPGAILIISAVPAGKLPPGIVDLAGIDAVAQNRPGGRLP